ncbi:MAG: hypothetical protein B6D63_04615 [Candidatus Latescibacteria bacterium 4484_7]|nr:MAG: hypothetical protein B6D63_04615 [Candidatus Latescibacteria bacterium 4484_7]RKZ09054.1 MAG: hypothetical protein DRQ05_00395 [bacterium]
MIFRAILFLVRVLLIILLIFYLIRVMVRWLIPHGTRTKRDQSSKGESREDIYKYLTNQKIEDADYEEIDSKESEDEKDGA